MTSLAAGAGAQEEPDPTVATEAVPVPEAAVTDPTGTDPAGAGAVVPGEETTTTLADLSTPGGPTRDAPLTESEKATRTIDLVVIALLALALIVAVVTIVFWRRTKPDRILAAEVARTAAARPSVLRSSGEQPHAGQWSSGPSGGVGAVGGAGAAIGGPAPVDLAPVDTALVESGAAASRSAFRTAATDNAAAPERRAPAEPGSWSEVAAAAGIESPGSSDAGAESLPSPAFESASGGLWASQGWGDGSPRPSNPSGARPVPTPQAEQAASGVEDPAPPPGAETGSVEDAGPGGQHEEPDQVLPPGFFGAPDDPRDGRLGASEEDPPAPNPFAPRR